MQNKSSFFLLTAIILLLLPACNLPLGASTPTPAQSVPSATPAASTEPSLTQQPSPTSALPTAKQPQPSPVPPTNQPHETSTGLHAVILVEEGDVLNIRAGAGVGSPIVGSFPPDAADLRRSGPTASSSSDLWVEVENPSGGLGWVNAYYLTETVTQDAFCRDTRIPLMLENLKQALVNADGELLASLVSPVHGLKLYYRRYGPSVNYTPEEASWVFQSTYQVNWGAGASGIDDIGSFTEIPLPKLLDVLTAPDYEQHCSDTGSASMYLEPWPPAYKNINFYALHKPATPDIDLDWRTWLVGVEYVQNKPYLFALIHFEWEP